MSIWGSSLVKAVYKTTAPTGADIGYPISQNWMDKTNDKSYQLVDITAGVATWKELGVTEVAGGTWVDRGTSTLSGNVLDASAGPGLYVLAAETGTTDQLDQVTGLAVGECIRVSPDTGDTITVADGANMNLRGINFSLADVKSVMELQCTATGVVKEIIR